MQVFIHKKRGAMTTMTARQQVALLLSLMVALLGASVIVGWYWHIPTLLQIHPSFAPMQFNTALGFLFSGMAVMAWQRSKFGLARILATGVLLIGGLTLWQIATGYNLHIDQLFMQHYVTVKTATPGRMAPNTALCFVLLGATLLLLTSALPGVIKTWINSVLAPAVLALALIALSGYGLGLETAYGWGNLTRMAVHTAAGFILLGLVLLLNQAAGQRLNPLPGIGIGIALLVGVLTLWQALRTEQVIALQAIAAQRNEQIQRNWQVHTELSRQALQRMAARWDGSSMSNAAWRIDAENYLKDFSFVALLRYDQSGAVSALGDARVAEQLLAHSPAASCLAANLPSWQLLQTQSEASDKLVVQVVAAARPGSGCIIAAHSLRQQIDAVRQQVRAERYPWTLSVQGRPLFQEASDGPWATQIALYPPQAGLSLSLTPTQAQRQGSAQPEWVLVAGLILSALIVLALYLMGVARRKAQESLVLQERLEAQMGELQRANEELNNFSYVASHDLKSPLRGIDQLASWIAEDLGDSLSGDTREHLRLMRSRIKRMEMLLDDLLAYSRVGRANGEAISINTRELVEAVFELQAPNKPIELLVADDMPIIKGQKVPLELVFRNLIGNAIKHHDKPQGTIRVSASKAANGFEFRVQDDGPGIAPEHQQRVFGMFQTLKPRDEIEGSGMGLALVKKAVESVGGTVTVESDGQQGSTFRFTWPMTNPKEHNE
jgi:signal transduction histidine kinase